MNTSLLCMNTERKINTKEHGVVRGLAVANVASCESSDHAKDYIAIAEGDHIIGCNSDGIRWEALIDEVVTATEDEDDSEKKGEAFFTRKELRDYCGWTDWSIRQGLEQLLELEYIAQVSGMNGSQYKYKLLVDVRKEAKQNRAITSVEELKKRMAERKQGK